MQYIIIFIFGANVLNPKLLTITCSFSEPRTQISPPLTFTKCVYVATEPLSNAWLMGVVCLEAVDWTVS